MIRDPLYDRAKGYGMILVVYGHMFTYGGIPFSIIFSFHMPLFFIISGMLLSPKKLENSSYSVWFRSILKKYMPPVLFFSILGGLIKFLVRGKLDFYKIASDFYLHMSSDELLTGAIWFLSMLTIVMLTIPFIIEDKMLKTGGAK